MFDTKKVRHMTALLKKIPDEFDDVYVIPDGIFITEAFALFKRLKIPVRAIMEDRLSQKEYCGLPVVKTANVSETFNERTILIILTKKALPLIQTTFDFKVQGGTWTVPALVMAPDEILAVYNGLMLQELVQMYKQDSTDEPTMSLNNLAERLARGLTTLLDPRFQNVKVDLWDSRNYFKPIYDFDDTAIVIQGPIAYDNNYTVNTFKLYRSIYPNVPIVVSTWKNEATDAFRHKCQENSVILLENDPPPSPGLFNVDMQLRSSLQGVKHIKENTSVKYCLKTRTDQRINSFDFLVYFKNLLDTFPPKGNKLNKRIIFLGSHIAKAYPFSPNDFLAFGHVLDIYKLYDIPLHGENGPLRYLKNHRKRLDKINMYLNHSLCRCDYNLVNKPSHKLYKLNKMMNRVYWVEMWLTRTFYEKYIAPVDATKLYETSWKFAVDYLILIDFDMIQLDWSKYEKMRYKPYFDYGKSNAFTRWLDMYRNFKIDWV